MSRKPRIIFFDLETAPDLKEVLRVFPSLSDYPGRTLKASITTVISFGYKVDDKKTKCKSVWDFKPRFNQDINDDYWVCKHAVRILNSADIIVSYNGKKFDKKFLQTRLMYHRLPLLRQDIIHIDLCEQSKRHLLLYSNRLGEVSRFLFNEEKLENGGWRLWCQVMNRIPEAFKLMSDYCKQDVELLPKIYQRLLPLISAVPNYNIYDPNPQKICPRCGSFDTLKSDGIKIRKHGKLQTYQCKTCHSYSSVRLESIKTPIKSL